MLLISLYSAYSYIYRIKNNLRDVKCYGAGTDGTVTELKTDVTALLQTLVRGSAGALALYI